MWSAPLEYHAKCCYFFSELSLIIWKTLIGGVNFEKKHSTKIKEITFFFPSNDSLNLFSVYRSSFLVFFPPRNLFLDLFLQLMENNFHSTISYLQKNNFLFKVMFGTHNIRKSITQFVNCRHTKLFGVRTWIEATQPKINHISCGIQAIPFKNNKLSLPPSNYKGEWGKSKKINVWIDFVHTKSYQIEDVWLTSAIGTNSYNFSLHLM